MVSVRLGCGRMRRREPPNPSHREIVVSPLLRLSSACLALLVPILAAAPAGAQDKPALKPVRVAYIPVVTWLPAWVAKDKGIFEKHGLDVTFTATQNISVLPATLGRQFDIAPSTPTDFLKAVAGGLDVVATAGEAIESADNPTSHVIVLKDSGFTEPKPLSGKLIATPSIGGVLHVSWRYWLNKNGVDPGSIRAVEVPFPNMPDQLKAKRVDAVEALEPFAGPLLAAGNVSLGDPILSAGREVLFVFWISSGTWARANGPTIKSWIAGLTEAKAYMDQNPEETRAILAKYTGLPAGVVQRVPFPTYRFPIAPEGLEVWANVLSELGLLSQPVDKTKLVVTAQ